MKMNMKNCIKKRDGYHYNSSYWKNYKTAKPNIGNY